MIKVFNETDTTFETNGNVVLNPTYANVHKEDNGDYYLDLETSIEEDKIKHIEHEEGTTIETTGTTLTDVDTTKEHKFISLYGDTQQDSTTGKNLYDVGTLTTKTDADVTFTPVYENGMLQYINVNGTASANVFYNFNKLTFQAGTYIINGCTYNDNHLYIGVNFGLGRMQQYSDPITFTLAEERTMTESFIRVQNGTQVNNVKVYPMIRLSSITDDTYEPYTNGASPNPNYPQEIHNVSGDNTIEICGKNLLDTSKLTMFSSNKYVATIDYTTKGAITIDSNTIYSVILNKSLLSDRKFYEYDSANTRTQITTTNTNIGDYRISTFTTSANAKTFGFYAGGSDSYTDLDTLLSTTKIMLLKGSYTTIPTYEAYTGQTQLISLGVENLLPNNATSQTIGTIDFTKNNDGSIYANGTANGQTDLYILGGTSTYVGLGLSAGTYTLSGCASGGSNTTYLIGCVVQHSDTTTTLYADYGTGSTIQVQTGDKFRIFIRVLNGKSVDGTFYPQLEKGSKKNSYTPYGANYIELNKISTYQDYIYKDNDRWYLHKEIGKKIYTGSSNETWGYANNVFYITESTQLMQNDIIGVKSNYFQGAISRNNTTNVNNNNPDKSICGTSDSINDRIYIKYSSITSVSDFRTWLSTHNTIVYYILANSTDTEITDTTLLEQLNNFEKMKLYNGITNISITPNDLTPIIKLHYNYITGGDVVINNNDYIKPNNIIVANTPSGEQAFRITDIDKRKHKIVLKAWHISYDTKNYVIQDSYVVDKTCNQAMDHLNNATDNTSPFTTTSDITTINSYRCVRKSLFEAFNVVLERWGGHFVRDNWNFKIMNSIGQDNGVVVRYAKNLKDIQVTYDWSQVVTKILPVGEDGLLLDEVFLYADIQYNIPYTKVVKFDQNIDDEPYRDEDGVLDEDAYKEALKADLRSQATAYLQEHYIPQVNYELNANLEKITDIGDTIQVKDERLGIDLLTNLISYDYDCILEKYKTLEFGNFRKTISDLTTYINTQTTSIVDDSVATTRITLQNELETATSQIWGVLGNSYVINEGDKILIVDSLPKETATNVWMFNNGGLAFSNTGINGTFKQAWTIDGTFNTQNINVINFTADLIKGGTLKLGSNVNQNGILEVYDEANNLIALLNKDGLRMNAVNGDYVLINQNVGFAGYDRNNNKIYWADGDEFHMKKSVVEEEITLVDKMRIIPITITNNGTIVNDGIGFVSTI